MEFYEIRVDKQQEIGKTVSLCWDPCYMQSGTKFILVGNTIYELFARHNSSRHVIPTSQDKNCPSLAC